MRPAPHRRFFDAWSRVYDLRPVQDAVYRPVHRAVLAELSDLTGGPWILDVGCGTGILTGQLAASTPATLVAGCDLSLGMLRRAAAKGGEPVWLQADAERLPLQPDSIDVAISTDSFHWFPDPDAVLAEFHRVLRPGGRVIVALVNPRLPLTAAAVRAASGFLGEPARWPTQREIVERLERAGFQVEAQRPVRRAASVVFPTMVTVAVRARSHLDGSARR